MFRNLKKMSLNFLKLTRNGIKWVPNKLNKWLLKIRGLEEMPPSPLDSHWNAVQNDTVNGSSFKKTHNMAAKESARKQSRRVSLIGKLFGWNSLNGFIMLQESDDLDLTGSPLRSDFDVNEKFDLSDVTEVRSFWMLKINFQKFLLLGLWVELERGQLISVNL